jgi:hypothetical protein
LCEGALESCVKAHLRNCAGICTETNRGPRSPPNSGTLRAATSQAISPSNA